MINYIKPTLDFLCYDFDKYAWLISISVLAVEVLLFLIALIIFSVKKKSGDGTYFLCASITLLIISAYFALEDYRLEKTLFESFKSVYVYSMIFAILITGFYMIIKRVSTKKEVKPIEKKQTEVIERLPISNAVRYFSKEELNCSYVDVSYIRTLIFNLKQKDLSDDEFSMIEDLEIYLLRFISRQPNGEERAVLSEYLSMLIKKLSLYAS